MSEYYKFIYTKKDGFKNIGTFVQHGEFIKKGKYPETIRGIIYDREKVVYLRVNDLFGNSLKTIVKFYSNFISCVEYLKKSYNRYKIYCSYTIYDMPKELRKHVLEI